MQHATNGSKVVVNQLDADDLAADLFFQELAQVQLAEAPRQAIFEKVERAKQEWEATVDALPELICLIDDRGRVLRANRTLETWGLGSVVDVKGRDFHDLIHRHCATPSCYLRHFPRARAETEAGRPIPELETYDAVLQRHLLIRVQPMPVLKRLASSAAVVVVQDVSERKRAEDALHRHAQRLEVVNEIGEAILAACAPSDIAQAALGRLRHLIPFHQARVTLWKPDTDQYLVMATLSNDPTRLRMGKLYPVADFRGSPERQMDRHMRIDDVSTLPDPSTLERQLAREGIRAYLSTPLIAENEFIGTLSLGSDRPAAFDSEHETIVCQIADLLAIAIRQAQLDENLSRSNKRLQAALAAKDQMIQNMSHELRTPLNLILGYATLLENGELGPLTDHQQHVIEVMRRKGDQLRFMVERLLVLRTFDPESLKRTPVNVDVWLARILRSWHLRAAESGIRLELEAPPTLPLLMADLDYLDQVVTNLVHNAIKFSPDGGRIQVSAREQDDGIVISVFDPGVGLSPEQLNRVFERFYQADGSSTRRFEGIGIGLALCQAIVEAHGGRIWAESGGEGQGSTFAFSLPLSPVGHGSAKAVDALESGESWQ